MNYEEVEDITSIIRGVKVVNGSIHIDSSIVRYDLGRFYLSILGDILDIHFSYTTMISDSDTEFRVKEFLSGIVFQVFKLYTNILELYEGDVVISEYIHNIIREEVRAW